MKNFGVYDQISTGGGNEHDISDAVPAMWG